MNANEYISGINLLEYFEEIKDQDSVFAYDFNEVQDLFYAPTNDCVFLVGNTGLGKKQLMGHLIKSLLATGKSQKDILFLDYNLPILFEVNVKQMVHEFIFHNSHQLQKSGQNLFLFINEIHFLPNWMDFIENCHLEYPNVKLVCASSACALVCEQLYADRFDFIKIIILSDKNNSNIKSASNGFGVYQQLKYNVKEGFIEIKGLTKEGKQQKKIIIPYEIEGKPVKIIASGAFHDRNELTQMALPDSVVMIGDYAFTKCHLLHEIHLPESLEFIGENAFLNANIKIIHNGNHINHIGNNAFYGTPWLMENKDEFVTLGNVLYKYQGQASSVCIPKNIVAITNWAFSNNDAITQVTIQNENCVVGEGAFYGCTNLKEIHGFSGRVEAFVFAYCMNLTQISSSSIKNVGDYAFFMCEKLSHMAIGSGQIGHCAFANCGDLQTVDGTPSILGKGAFYKCSALKSLSLDSIEKMDAFALYHTGLEDIVINAQYIGDYALANNIKVDRIRITPKTKLGSLVLWGNTGLKSLIISGKYQISYYFGALNEIKVNQIEIQDDIIVDNLLRQYHAIDTLRLTGIKHFGRWAFYGCNNLTHVEISNDIPEIGDWAFTNCEKLIYIELPASIQKIGMNAFRYCSNLQEIKLKSPHVVPFLVNAFYGTPSEKRFFVPNPLLAQYRQDHLWKEYLENLEGFD
jgi:hypothetical protein